VLPPGYLQSVVSGAESSGTAGRIPDGLVLRRHLELGGRRPANSVRHVLVAVLALIPSLALVGYFGQSSSISTAENDTARLTVDAPQRLRGGLLFQARLEVLAKRDLSKPSLVLGPGWIEGMQVNSVKPEPTAERGREGGLVLEYGRIRAGEALLVRIQFQVDPTSVGRRAQDVSVEDGGTSVLEVDRTVIVFP
jgi:hypothetical protein